MSFKGVEVNKDLAAPCMLRGVWWRFVYWYAG